MEKIITMAVEKDGGLGHEPVAKCLPSARLKSKNNMVPDTAFTSLMFLATYFSSLIQGGHDEKILSWM